MYDINKEKEKELIKFLRTIKEVAWVGLFEGIWDLGIVLLCKNLNDFLKFKEEIIGKFGDYFQETSSSVAIKISQYKHNYYHDDFSFNEKVWEVTDNIVKLDKVDMNLLHLLRKNCREPLINIANKLNLSANAIKYRLKNLENKKVILAYCTQINYFKFDTSYFKVFFTFHKLSRTKITKLSNYIKNLKYTLYIVKAIGRYDYEVEFIVKDHKEFYELMKKIRRKFADLIKDYEYYVVQNIFEMHYLPVTVNV